MSEVSFKEYYNILQNNLNKNKNTNTINDNKYKYVVIGFQQAKVGQRATEEMPKSFWLMPQGTTPIMISKLFPAT